MAQLICQDIEEKDYSKYEDCVMLIYKIPEYMPQPLDRLERWSCEKRPTLCIVEEVLRK